MHNWGKIRIDEIQSEAGFCQKHRKRKPTNAKLFGRWFLCRKFLLVFDFAPSSKIKLSIRYLKKLPAQLQNLTPKQQLLRFNLTWIVINLVSRVLGGNFGLPPNLLILNDQFERLLEVAAQKVLRFCLSWWHYTSSSLQN